MPAAIHLRPSTVSSFMRSVLLIAVLVTFVTTCDSAEPPLLRKGDRVAILGGTFVERMQNSGALEAEVQCRKPGWQLRFRNLGWSGDDVHGIARKRFDTPEDGFKRLLADVETARPTVVLVAYGFAEASDGAEAVQRFEPGLRQLVEALHTDERRVILITPIAMPGFRIAGYSQWMDRCRASVNRLGEDLEIPVVNVDWMPAGEELTEDRLLPNVKGYAAFARHVADLLVGGERCSGDHQEFADLIAEKNQLFFHRYRPQNETYLFLFRKHEQGNNASEIPKFDPLIDKADEAIWDAFSRHERR